MGMTLENPIAFAALICFVLGLVLSGLVRMIGSSAVASTVLPIIFLASYVVTYQQVPPFPPVGSTNKIFYIAVAATLAGLVLDLLPRAAIYRRPFTVVMPLLIVGWIGFPRFAKPDIELIATCLGLWLGGIALLWRLDTVATALPDHNGGSIVGTAMLMALLLAFAPAGIRIELAQRSPAVRPRRHASWQRRSMCEYAPDQNPFAPAGFLRARYTLPSGGRAFPPPCNEISAEPTARFQPCRPFAVRNCLGQAGPCAPDRAAIPTPRLRQKHRRALARIETF
jgi:hypothetical protein